MTLLVHCVSLCRPSLPSESNHSNNYSLCRCLLGTYSICIISNQVSNCARPYSLSTNAKTEASKGYLVVAESPSQSCLDLPLGVMLGHQAPPPQLMSHLMVRATQLTHFSTWVTLGITTLRFNLQLPPHWGQELTELLNTDFSAFLVLALNESPQTVRKLIRLQLPVF